MKPSTLRPQTRSQSGAFDLPSVLIGVAVVAILAIGVMATIFGVIPWAQDRAAKQDLAAMNTAQGTMYARDGNFTDKAALVAAGWLGEGTPATLDAKADVEGKCYVAVTTSKTGNQFVISHDKPAPRELTTADTWCNGSRILKDTAPVMIATWNTSLAANCKEITLPLSSDFKGTVDWGDGTKDSSTTHAFTSMGPVSVRVDGTFAAWKSNYSGADANCLVSVDRWGETGTTSLYAAFRGAINLKHVESIPASATVLSYAFHGVTSDFTIGAFDTSNVTDISFMFNGARSFNQPVDFDTSRITTMEQTFEGAAAFNQPLNFNTSNVTTMERMFSGAAAFNQLVRFDTSKVTGMRQMFNGASVFNRAVAFDTSSVTDMSGMFSQAHDFNQPLNFDTSNVTTMASMFEGAKAFNQPLSFTDTSSAVTMYSMFSGASVFNQPLNFNTSNVVVMDQMFYVARAYNQDLSGWNVSKVTGRSTFISESNSAWTLPKPNWVD